MQHQHFVLSVDANRKHLALEVLVVPVEMVSGAAGPAPRAIGSSAFSKTVQFPKLLYFYSGPSYYSGRLYPMIAADL